eukprot:GHVR01167582.1.p1 GENE.GHVR01167582.1~~GHVR01167582.1.p1  ORF type:complete len:206 (-),score=74.89 GHVR01167582.1:405-953(-)
MRKLRRIPLFESSPVTVGTNTTTCNTNSNNITNTTYSTLNDIDITCCAGTSTHLWIGDATGTLHRLDMNYCLSSMNIFDLSVRMIKITLDQLLVAIGGKKGQFRYKIFGINSLNSSNININNNNNNNNNNNMSCEVALLRESPLFPQGKNTNELDVTDFDCMPHTHTHTHTHTHIHIQIMVY